MENINKILCKHINNTLIIFHLGYTKNPLTILPATHKLPIDENINIYYTIYAIVLQRIFSIYPYFVQENDHPQSFPIEDGHKSYIFR